MMNLLRAGFLLAAVAASADAAVISFETLAHNDDGIVQHGAIYTEAGFVLTNLATEADSGFPPSFATLGALAEGYTGSTALINDNYRGDTRLHLDSPLSFSLYRITLAELLAADAPIEVTFRGVRGDGSTVAQTFTLDGLAGSQTFAFSGFNAVQTVTWTQTDLPHQFDNIDAVPTPEPLSAGLIGLGLLGLMALKRKLA